ncbi:hypothetical protein JOM56_005659 [Amanita muscaria]
MYDKREIVLRMGMWHIVCGQGTNLSYHLIQTTLAIFGEVRDAHLSLSTQSASNLCPFTPIVDDYDMGITHVLRDLYVYLKFPSRAYTHHSQPRWDKQNGYMQMIDFIGVSVCFLLSCRLISSRMGA